MRLIVPKIPNLTFIGPNLWRSLFLENLLDDISIRIDEFYLIVLTRDSYKYICYMVGICYLFTNTYLIPTIEYYLIMELGSIASNRMNSVHVSLIASILTQYSDNLVLDREYGIDWGSV